MYCDRAIDFELPSTLESIGENVFWSTAATSIELPKNLKSIGYFSFMCSSLENITFPSGVSLSGGVFQSGENLISAEFENGITYIPYNTFNGAYVLNHVIIPDTVTGIGEYSFCQCKSLSNIVIPSSVTSIGKNAFYECDNLKYVVIPETVKNIGDHAFGYNDHDDEADTYIKQEGFIIYGYAGTAAENYAKDNQITFIALEDVKGDVNADGEFNVSDVVLLQKWLLALPDTHLPHWKAGDFCKDDKLDVFDLCLMKRELLNR